MTLPEKLHSALLRVWFLLHGVKLGKGCLLARGCGIERGRLRGARGTVSLSDGCSLQRGAQLQAWGGSIHLGREVSIGSNTVIYGQGGVRIGDASSISMRCRILSSHRATPPAGATEDDPSYARLPTSIGREVLLEAGVVILGGVTIGDRCLVGAGSVVASDLPPGSVAMGIPARITGRRE